ncbi:tetratricopeptide repeat protein [Microbaculum sp. FT89]|uniref:tetratricopeptide repeat protein n=1 Tax=Microbaculum sp. FT89 TaxID=3447298 RepID=UPI003F53B3AF
MIKAKNGHGLTFTCPSPEAPELFDRVVRSYLAFGCETGTHLKTLMRSCPGMAMAHCLRGYFLMFMGTRALATRALDEAAAGLEDPEGLEPRERMHLAALRAWAGGSLPGATRLWDEIARNHPRDVLALKMAHFGHFYTGHSRNIRDGVARALDFWTPKDAEYSFLRSMYAFGLEESGDYVRAERVVRDALDRNPDDPWGIHALAHVYEATERFDTGVRCLTEMERNWKPVNNFRYHVAWHRALFHYEAGDPEAALEAFDADVFDPEATEDLDLCNDASLLLRIELGGVDVGDRWAAVATKVESRGDDLMMPFVDTHVVLALASSPDPGHRARARALTEAMHRYGADSDEGNAVCYRDVGAELAQAVLNYREGRAEQSWGTLAALLDRVQAIGGSHAQRDLFWEIAADALEQSEPYGADAVAFYGARSHSRQRDGWNWQRYLAALENSDRDDALRAARIRYQAAAVPAG